MKLNLHRPFKGMKGEDIQNKEGHVQLMDEVLCEILFAGSFIRPSGDTDQDARRKMRAFELYQKLSQAQGEADFTAEECALMKEAALQLNVGGYGQIVQLVEGKNEK